VTVVTILINYSVINFYILRHTFAAKHFWFAVIRKDDLLFRIQAKNTFSVAQRPTLGLGNLIVGVSRSHTVIHTIR
jgi:hypothetical protein